MGRPSNTEERRREIVFGLRRAMARLGYARATVAEIAREAGLAPGLVHYHFADKAEILRSLIDGLGATARARIEVRVALETTARGRLEAFIDALLARGLGDDTDAAACWALVGAEAMTQPEVRALYAQFVAEIATRLGTLLVAACHAEGRSGDGCRALAGALVATIEGYFALGSAVPEVVPLGSAAAMTKRMARGLVHAQPKKERR